MTSDHRYADVTQATIDQWNHEIIELEARIANGTESEEQLRASRQHLTELKSRRDEAQRRLNEANAK